MTDEQNRKIVEEYMNAWASADESKLEGLIDTSYKFNAPPGFTGDKKGALEMSRQYSKAFPDMKMTYSNWVCQGENVTVRCLVAGTHKGEFMGIAPTNKKADTTGLALIKVRNGKIVEDISEFDQLGMLTKLGVIPPMGATPGPSASRPARPGPGRVAGSHEREEQKLENPGDL